MQPSQLDNPLPSGPPARDPRARVKLPTTLIIVSQALGILLQLSALVFRDAILAALKAYMEGAGRTLPPDAMNSKPLLTAVSLLGSGFVVFAMLKLRKLESFPIALIGTIVAMLPLASSCCCFGLPLGIWTLIILFDPDVRAAFT